MILGMWLEKTADAYSAHRLGWGGVFGLPLGQVSSGKGVGGALGGLAGGPLGGALGTELGYHAGSALGHPIGGTLLGGLTGSLVGGHLGGHVGRALLRENEEGESRSSAMPAPTGSSGPDEIDWNHPDSISKINKYMEEHAQQNFGKGLGDLDDNQWEKGYLASMNRMQDEHNASKTASVRLLGAWLR